MAARGAKISALRVDLGINTAQFSSGLGQAEGRLGKFGKIAGTAFAAVAAAGAAAAVALGYAVKQAADHADQLSKTAQKIGVATEALSRLEWAAKLSDVSLEQLSTGLGRLSRNMLDVASGTTGPAKVAFDALGIAVTDATGQLRASDEVFAEIAEKFSLMEDGSTKTALAMSLLGRSGAEMIPLLNMGSKGLADMAAESDRLGQTISTETGRAAEEFNDNLTRLNAVMGGLVNRIMADVVPGLADLTATLADPQFQKAASDTVGFFIGLVNVLAQAVTLARELADVLPKAVGAGEDASLYKNIPGYEDFIRQHEVGAGGGSGIGGGPGSFESMLSTMGVSVPAAEPFVVDMEAIGGAAAKAKESIDPLAARIDELSDVLTITHDPITQMQMDLTDLDTLWKEGRISVEQYGQAVMMTQANAAASVLGMAGQVSGALASLFQDNKAFAVANAVINTAEGVTKALAQGGLFGFVGAAAVGVAGAAQIAAILSAQPGRSASPAPVQSSPVAPTAAGAGQAINITFRGEGGVTDEVRKFWDQLQGDLADQGKQIVVVPV